MLRRLFGMDIEARAARRRGERPRDEREESLLAAYDELTQQSLRDLAADTKDDAGPGGTPPDERDDAPR
jgi:hypothetical protein